LLMEGIMKTMAIHQHYHLDYIPKELAYEFRNFRF